MSDAQIHQSMNSGSTAEKLDAIAMGASRFRFSQELKRMYDQDIGLPRFQPALNVIDSLTVDSFSPNTAESILHTARQISAHYGNENVVSATTKLLWMKFRFPIIIHDKNAEIALGTKLLHDYYDQWKSRFDYYEQSVIDACSALNNVLEYVYDPAIATSAFVSNIAASTWFQYRVFGTYLTNIGRHSE